jgi:uncharacterized membrane protein YcaP (DUF421 family)
MQAVAEWGETLLALSAKAEDITLAQVAVRAVIVYGALIIFVRFGKKRFLAQATPFDAILLILIGSIASRGVSGTAPFFTSILASGWLIALHSIFSYISCRSDRFSHWIKGNPTVLVKEGQIDRSAMLNTHMSGGDLDEDLRKKGLVDPSNIVEARLERDGTVSVIKGP